MLFFNFNLPNDCQIIYLDSFYNKKMIYSWQGCVNAKNKLYFMLKYSAFYCKNAFYKSLRHSDRNTFKVFNIRFRF